MKTAKIPTLFLGLVAALAPVMAQAEVIFSENFDSYTLPSDGGFKHMTSGGTPDDSLLGVTDEKSHSKNNSLVHFIDSPEEENVMPASSRTVPQGIPLSTDQRVQLKLKVNSQQINTTWSVYLCDNTNKQLTRLTLTNVGDIWALNGMDNSTRTVVGKYVADTWYEVTILVDPKAQSWDVTIKNLDDASAPAMESTGRQFFQPPGDTAQTINRITFGGTVAKKLVGKVYVDDIELSTVPPKSE